MKLEEIKEGDYVVYAELPYSDYANSLNKVVSVNDTLYPQPLCIEWEGKYIDYTNMKDAVAIEKYFDENNWFLAIGYEEGMSAIEYMNQNWELGKCQNRYLNESYEK